MVVLIFPTSFPTLLVIKVILLAILAKFACGKLSGKLEIENFKKSSSGYLYSNDIYEDALLDVPSLIKKYGYPVEVHTVTTPDGYILTTHRISHGRDRNNQHGRRPVVFVMHGLFSSSADFIVLGPGNALAYVLAEEGYDVWLGNARGNYYSRKHISLDPDTSKEFWLFSWEEIGLYDIPTFVDYILSLTGETALHYVGHSQGNTVFYVLNCLKPEYNAKFKSHHALSPAVYFRYCNRLLKIFTFFHKSFEKAVFLIHTGEVVPLNGVREIFETIVCKSLIFEPSCVKTIMTQMNETANANPNMLPVFVYHGPAGASIRQVAHFAQVIRRDKFARYDHGIIKNYKLYGTEIPPAFNLSKVTVPSYVYYGLGDQIVNWQDIRMVGNDLGNTIKVYRVKRDNFNHVDFLWHPEAKELIYNKIIEHLQNRH